MYDHEQEEETVDWTQPLEVAKVSRPDQGRQEATLLSFMSVKQMPKFYPSSEEVTVHIVEFKVTWEDEDGNPCEDIKKEWLDMKDPSFRGKSAQQKLEALTRGYISNGLLHPKVDPKNRIGEVFAVTIKHKANDDAAWYINAVNNLE